MRGVCRFKVIRCSLWYFFRLIGAKDLSNAREIARKNSHNSFFKYNDFLVLKAVSDLRENGATQGVSLNSNYVDEILSYANSNPCFADRDETKGFYLKEKEGAEKKLGKKILLAQYFNIEDNPLVKKLSEDPYILSVAANYLGVSPKLMSANMWWTFPVDASDEEKSRHAHVFHYDLDDVKFVKFFFYITDVDNDSGPHVYVKGSNRKAKHKKSLFKSRRYTDDEIFQCYGKENVISLEGEAGTCLIEDTITMHKGVTPVSKPRLVLQFEYAVNKYAELSCVRDKEKQKMVM